MLAGATASAQGTPKPAKALPAPGLLLAPLAGQAIPVLPATYIVADSAIPGLPATRLARLAWADSVLMEALEARGPEATWTSPAEVRRIARRAAGTVTDPDRMGQSLLRYSNINKVPDPLLSNLRALIALTDSRVVLIPAMYRFTKTADGVRAEATLVMVDARSGSVPWRSNPVAVGPDAAAALAGTIAWILPEGH
jgi:hypothetical protein